MYDIFMKPDTTPTYIDGIRKPSKVQVVPVKTSRSTTKKSDNFHSTAIAQNPALVSQRIMRNRTQLAAKEGRVNHVKVTFDEQPSLFDSQLPTETKAQQLAALALLSVAATVLIVVIIFNLTR